MRIETQFDLGQRVWAIYSGRKEYTAPCMFCDCARVVIGVDGSSRPCPECFGRGGKQAWHLTAWHVERELTVGQVRVAVTNSPGDESGEFFDNFRPQVGGEEEYMCVETGIGSGSVWRSDVLFATRDEAQAACDERNAAQVAA